MTAYLSNGRPIKQPFGGGVLGKAVVALLGLTVVAGCAASPSSQSASEPTPIPAAPAAPEVTQPPEPEVAPEPEFEYSMTAHSITAEDSNGNKQRVTLEIGSWIRGNNLAVLDAVWLKVGGLGQMPLAEGEYRDMENAAFVFGTMAVENVTPDFPAKNYGEGNSYGIFLQPKVGATHDGAKLLYEPVIPLERLSETSVGLINALQCRQYGDRTSCDAVGQHNPLGRPGMTSNHWGPMAFVMAIQNVFTPNYPDGNPSFPNIEFGFIHGYSLRDDSYAVFSAPISW